MAEPWLELVQTIQDVPAPAELRQEILRRRALRQSDATGSRRQRATRLGGADGLGAEATCRVQLPCLP